MLYDKSSIFNGAEKTSNKGYKVNVDKITRLVHNAKTRGRSMHEISRELGYSGNFLSLVLAQGTTTATGLLRIADYFNINPKEFLYYPAPTQISIPEEYTASEPKINNDTYLELQEIKKLLAEILEKVK